MIASILALACCTRLVLFLVVAPHPERFHTPDSPGYVALARNFSEAYAGRKHASFVEPAAQRDEVLSFIRSGQRGYQELPDLALLRTPAYPLLIHLVYAAVGEKPWAVILVQVALSVFTVWLIYAVGLRIFGPQAGRLASLALAIDPISVIMTNYLQPEVFFTLGLVAGFLCWSRALGQGSHGWSAGAGVLLGASVLIRPVAWYLPVVLVPVGWILQRDRWSKGLALSGVFLLAFALPVGGWIFHNYRVTGVPILSTVEGLNLLKYRAAVAVAEEEGLSHEEAWRRLQVALKERTQSGMNQAEISRVATRLGFETVAKHPVGGAVTAIKGAARLLAGPGLAGLLTLLGADEPQEIKSGLHAILVGAEIFILWVVMFGSALGSYWLLRSRRYFELIAVVSFIIYLVAASAGLEAYSRFRAPIMPYFALLAGYAVASKGVRTGRRPGW